MSIKASVSKGFGVSTKSLPVVGVLALFGFIWNLVNIYFAPKVQTPDTRTSVMLVLASVVFIFASIFLQAGSLGYIRDRIKQGEANFSHFISAGARYYLRFFAVGLIMMLLVVVFIIVGALAVAFLKTAGVVLAVLIGIVAVYVVMLMLFSPYVVVANDEKVIAAIKKSIELVKKNILGVLGLAAILILIGFAIGLVTGILFGLLNAVTPGVASQVIFALLSSVLNAFLGIFVTASFMTFYLEISAK